MEEIPEFPRIHQSLSFGFRKEVTWPLWDLDFSQTDDTQI